ncbi:transmembrane protein 106B-like isoform X1 [Channa argus]|nr:hypothetical protein Q8A73_015741 [Channa argus]
MGAVPRSSDDCTGEPNDKQPITEKDDHKKWSSNWRRHSAGGTVLCPTCEGTGRIPRGQESRLVAYIPCSDQRLRPRHTKLYVAVSVGVCLLVSALALFFLFPRAVLLSPVTVKSSFVYFGNDSVQINITNAFNITNSNFVPVQVYNLKVQAINFDVVVGTVSIKNVGFVQPLSVQMSSFMIPINVTDPGLSSYCKKASLPVHILYLHLQMSVAVYYMAHSEQISSETYEYIDCGANNTRAHST